MGGGKHEHSESWTGSDDAILSEVVAQFGTQWKRVTDRLPTRSLSSVRNRWQRIQKGRAVEGKNKCRICGVQKRGHSCNGGSKTPVHAPVAENLHDVAEVDESPPASPTPDVPVHLFSVEWARPHMTMHDVPYDLPTAIIRDPKWHLDVARSLGFDLEPEMWAPCTG